MPTRGTVIGCVQFSQRMQQAALAPPAIEVAGGGCEAGVAAAEAFMIVKQVEK